MSEPDALVAEARAYVEPPDGHREPCLICGEPCSALAGNPSLWPLRLGNDGWHHTGCVNKALCAIAAARAAAIEDTPNRGSEP